MKIFRVVQQKFTKLFPICLTVVFLFGAAKAQSLTPADVQTVIAQAVSTAVSLNQRVTVVVTDREGNVLGIFEMTGANPSTRIRGPGLAGRGLENVVVPAFAAGISKAGTASFFSTTGNAFTTRSASFIIQEHFPPTIDFRPGGPLYGVQFSSLPCSDVKRPGLPLGLSGDSGGLPLYKNGVAVGGIGVEGDGLYTVDRNPYDNDLPPEEIIAVAGTRGYEAPAFIRGDQILIEGIRLPYANLEPSPNPPATIPFGSLPGALRPGFPIRGTQPSAFVPQTLGGVAGEVDPRFFPAVAGTVLTAAEVLQILTSGAQTANITRAGIRQPLGSSARVSITVVDVDGRILGIFRTADAPVFGFDVSAQKARSSLFFARSDAGARLTAAGMGNYVQRAAADGLMLNGSIAFSDRAIGFNHRPFFPDGINGSPEGAFSSPLSQWSPFNVGLQLDLIVPALTNPPPQCMNPMTSKKYQPKGAMCRCIPSIPILANGLQIFAGGIPLYKNGVLAGAIGISGDGIEQDDFIAAGGGNNFAPPVPIRSDQFFVRGTRLPFLKFPARPTL